MNNAHTSEHNGPVPACLNDGKNDEEETLDHLRECRGQPWCHRLRYWSR